MNPTPFHLTDKKILVTGASSGIGRQVAISASGMGAKIILTGRNNAELKKTCEALSGDGHEIISCDILEQSERDRLSKEISQIDGVVHCAGTVKPFPIKFLDQQKLDETL